MGNMVRFDPWDDLFRGFFVKPVDLPTGMSANDTQTIRMDVREDKDAYHVVAEMPGVRKEDIHVAVDGSAVSISAEVKQQKEVKEGERLLRSERYFGQVSRSFQLAQDVDDERAVAQFDNGVLELTLPKRAATRSRRLEIR